MSTLLNGKENNDSKKEMRDLLNNTKMDRQQKIVIKKRNKSKRVITQRIFMNEPSNKQTIENNKLEL